LAALWKQNEHEPIASDGIYATLRKAILSGVLVPGDHVGEVELARLFKRSRTPVRQATLRLESDCLLERSRRSRLIVSRIRPAEILEVFVVRGELDSVSVRIAAQSILPSELEHLRWINDQMRIATARTDPMLTMMTDIRFHEAICRATRNSLLLQFMRHIHVWVQRFPDTTYSHPERTQAAIVEHCMLLEALDRHDAEEAERVARRHNDGALQARIAMVHAAEANS
jgi:DNA-binding GntR family transcriptional regulator